MSVIQLIDEDKKFSPDVAKYFQSLNISKAGLDYDVVSVFGSQSTGKSTLLNALFGTEFGVMDVKARRQTTKGIWLGVEKLGPQLESARSKPLLVLDVEGTDGRERGEDQDFERKSALFAMATSETLIINMWEHQVGLYVGANMALLRTVFEVNLSLFQAGRGKLQRSRLMFAIRDFIGLTPLETLAETLTEDLVRQWDSVAKPEGLENSKLTDFFDLDFVGLPNKMLQREEFFKQVANMLTQLKTNFLPEYHRNVPIDGWPMYAEQVWEQIEMNKDLDLPTHQILVARFRCEDIADTTFAEFESAVAALNQPFGDAIVIPDFGESLRVARSEALHQFDETAGKYHNTVYNEKRLDLLGRIDGVLTAYFTSQLNALTTDALATFKQHLDSTMKTPGLTFKDRLATATASAQSAFSAGAREAVIDPSFYSFHSQEDELNAQLARAASEARDAELRRVLKRASKRLVTRLDPVDLHFNNFPDKLDTPWDAVQETLNSAITDVLNEHPEEGLGLGGSPEEVSRANLMLNSEAWRMLASKIGSVTTPDAVLQRMRDRFEDVFKYSPEGLPIVWNPGDDIEGAASRSRENALRLLPIFSSAELSSGVPLAVPPEVAQHLREVDEDVPEFDALLTVQQQQDVERRFQRMTDSAFVDAKRSVMQLTTHIPPYIYAIIAVLGWNEFTMVLRNPLLILLVLIIGGAAYIVYNLGMADHVLNLADSAFHRVLAEGKEYLRNYLLSEEERKPRRVRSSSGRRGRYFEDSSNHNTAPISPLISPRNVEPIKEPEDFFKISETREAGKGPIDAAPVPSENASASVTATEKFPTKTPSVPQGPEDIFVAKPTDATSKESGPIKDTDLLKESAPLKDSTTDESGRPVHHVTLEDIGED